MIELHEMERLVEAIEQELGRSLCPLVRQAFLQVPRHLFVEQYYQQRGSSLTWDLVQATMESVYRGQPLVIQIDQRGRPTSSSSQPSIMAIQLEALDLESGHLFVVMSQVGAPFLLLEQLLKSISLDELFAQIRANYQREIEAYAIELGEERNLSLG